MKSLQGVRAQVKASFARRWTRFELALLVPCVALFLVTAFASERLRLRGYVLPGVVVGELDVSGYSEQALRSMLEQQRAALRGRLFRVVVGDLEFRFTGQEVGADLDVSRHLREALARGRTGSVVAQLWWRVQRFSSPDTLPRVPHFERRLWHDQVAAFERAALQTPEEGGLVFERGEIRRVDPRAGEFVPREAADTLLERQLRATEGSVLTLPLATQRPRTAIGAVDAVEQRARRLLGAPLTLAVAWPPDLPVPARLAEQDPNSEVRPEDLVSALRVVAADGRPQELELGFDESLLLESLERIRTRWERPSTDASFEVDRRNVVSLVPSSIGARVDPAILAAAVLEASSRPERRAELRLVPAEPPRITTQLAQSLGVRGLVAQFTTHHPCCRPRVHNIHRIADIVNGTIVLPGETFSLNGLIGPRSHSNGFEPAPTIVHGEMKDTFGGGISQFTTTLFNAVLDGGYEIVERQPHSFYFPRYPLGHEATLSFPKPDLIFRNDSAHGLVLVTEYSSTWIRVKLFGDNEGRRTSREVSPRFDFVDPPIEYVSDDRVVPGESKLIERGSRGFSVNVSRTVRFADGRAETQSRKVTYEPRPRVVAVHSCEVPEGEEGHTGLDCPELEEIGLDGGVLAMP